MLSELRKELKKNANPPQSKNLQRFFKTGKGEYGEGDVFLGIKVPKQREIAKNYFDLDLKDIDVLLDSGIHEERLVGLLILVQKFEKGNDKIKKEIFNFYLGNTKGINNWDLVDLSCHKIVGKFLLDRPKERKILYKLAKSDLMWDRRIAIVSTYAFIRKNQLDDVFALGEILLGDKEDLMHKAVGWMLREAGKKDEDRLKEFLKEHYNDLPRTTLRYAIEKFKEVERKRFLRGEF